MDRMSAMQLSVRLLAGLISCSAVAATAQAPAQEPAPAPAPATAPARIKPAPPPATAATAAPAVPGELRPEKPVAPLISVPLRRGATDDGRPTTASVDDSMARCKAMKPGSTERNDCLRKARITAPKP
jgi:hypothetical protein